MNFENMTAEELKIALASLQAENEKLKAAKASKISFKVSEKGGVSVYGLGRFPVSLYKSQWDALLARTTDLQAFITANAAILASKEKAAEG